MTQCSPAQEVYGSALDAANCLPHTGFSLGWVVVAAALLILAGIYFRYVSRTRRAERVNEQ